jgi:hypothetical protein
LDEEDTGAHIEMICKAQYYWHVSEKPRNPLIWLEFCIFNVNRVVKIIVISRMLNSGP